MLALLYILIISFLLLVAYQDFKQRAIWWGLIPILLSLSLGISSETVGFTASISFFGLNLLFLCIQFAFAMTYFSLKNRTLVNIVDRYVGWGDILFFISICTLFSPVNFVFSYTISLFAVLAVTLGIQFINNEKVDTIPLAGAVALLLVACFIFDYFAPWSRYLDFSLI